MNRCAICGATENLRYCGLCDKWFCPTCKANYPARARAASKSWIDHVRAWLGVG